MKIKITYLLGISLWVGSQLFAQQNYISASQNPTLAPQYGNAVPNGQQNGALPRVLPTSQLEMKNSDVLMAPQAVPEGTSPTGPHPAPELLGEEAPGDLPVSTHPANPSVQAVPPQYQGIENGLLPGWEAGDGCAVCGGGYCQPPLWYDMQGVRVMNRSRPRRVTLGVQYETVTNSLGQQVVVPVSVFNTRSVNYDVAPGYYVTLGRYLGRDSQGRDDFVEFTYWGMNTWNDSNFYMGSRVTDTQTLGHDITFGNLFSPFPTNMAGFNRADSHTVSINSELHNWELNLRLRPRGRPDQFVMQPNGRWRRECTPGAYMSYLVGLRYMTIGDGFRWRANGYIQDEVLGNHFTYGNYEVQTENNLLGLQIGTDMIFRRCKWSWGVHAKVGPYVNFARGMQDIQTQGTGDPFALFELNDRFNTRKQKVALVGEVGFEANYKFTPSLTGRISYDFMWVSGLALAPEQLQFTATPQNYINTDGGMFSQGLTMGLEWTW
jgi:hypothetical protein